MHPELFELFVNGTLMRGLALHSNLADATFLGVTATAPCYRVYSINDVHPGMYRLEEGEAGGISVNGELYIVSHQQWLRIEAGEPPNLYRGRVLLQDGREVWGILYPRELAAVNGHDISQYGDWRSYMGSK
jgi:gamma-glutamylcyclotransferase (GGCT)/AIG2-like uncharacterized protein YtfP